MFSQIARKCYMTMTNGDIDHRSTWAWNAIKKHYSVLAWNWLPGPVTITQARCGESFRFSKAGECDLSVKFPNLKKKKVGWIIFNTKQNIPTGWIRTSHQCEPLMQAGFVNTDSRLLLWKKPFAQAMCLIWSHFCFKTMSLQVEKRWKVIHQNVSSKIFQMTGL